MRINHNIPVPSPQPQQPSAELLALRRNWKWAYLSHFLFTFNPVLHLEDIQLQELEDDLVSGTYVVLPTVMQRLLMSLTPHDKRMILEDWQHQLRRQSLKRAPEENLMGTDDEPVDFESLLMMDKLDLFHALCEWQFHNPNSLRSRMRDDDEFANWRIQPIAYDAKGNGYWLMGGNRLWVQQAPSRKRVPKSKKRKRPAASASNGQKSAKRTRVAPSANTKLAPPPPKPANAKPKGPPASTRRPVRETRSRAAGLPVQAKSRPLGTRVSSRLRGREEEELWQEIPEEWLKNDDEGSDYMESGDDRKGKGKGKGRFATSKVAPRSLDDISELTSLSDLSDLPDEDEENVVEEDDDDDEEEAEVEAEDDAEEEEEEEEEEDEEAEMRSPTPLQDYSTPRKETWETVCITLQEWEEFPTRFEDSSNRREKAFYKLLVDHVVPMITEVLKVDVRKQIMEEAVVSRKRSSRLAVKESIREAEREEARRKAEEEKELERHKRWEARVKKEEEARQKLETMKSVRIREKAGIMINDVKVDIDGDEVSPATSGNTLTHTPIKFVVNVSKSGTQTPKEDEAWELDCEICHKRGMNLDDGQELMSCGKCNKWQHIRCHDQTDFITGRPRRNWEFEDFICKSCSGTGQASSSRLPTYAQTHVPSRNAHNGPSIVTETAAPKRVVATKDKVHKQPATPAAATYGNGRGYPFPPQGHPSYPMAHYALPQPASSTPASSTGGSANNIAAQPRGHTLSLSPSTHPSVPPYSAGPNMYLSIFSAGGGYRPSGDHAPNPSQPPPVQSHYRLTVPAPVTPQSTWSHQSQPSEQVWAGGASGSGTQPYTAAATPTVLSNRRNRPPQPAPLNHFPPPLPAPVPSPTQHHSGGPGPQQ